jgi:charged multivesicular body protein 1
MRQVTGNMTSVVRGMDKAMESMNLERVRALPRSPPSPADPAPQISQIMDKFETQFSDLDVQTSYMEDTMGAATAVSTPQDQVEALMRQAAEEANIELAHDLAGPTVERLPAVAAPKDASAAGEEDARLAERLRALRPV